MSIQLVMDIAAIVAVTVLATVELMLWYQLRQFNRNFHKVEATIARAYDELKPLINALNKASPFLEVFNSITGLFTKRKPKVTHARNIDTK